MTSYYIEPFKCDEKYNLDILEQNKLKQDMHTIIEMFINAYNFIFFKKDKNKKIFCDMVTIGDDSLNYSIIYHLIIHNKIRHDKIIFNNNKINIKLTIAYIISICTITDDIINEKGELEQESNVNDHYINKIEHRFNIKFKFYSSKPIKNEITIGIKNISEWVNYTEIPDPAPDHIYKILIITKDYILNMNNKLVLESDYYCSFNEEKIYIKHENDIKIILGNIFTLLYPNIIKKGELNPLMDPTIFIPEKINVNSIYISLYNGLINYWKYFNKIETKIQLTLNKKNKTLISDIFALDYSMKEREILILKKLCIMNLLHGCSDTWLSIEHLLLLIEMLNINVIIITIECVEIGTLKYNQNKITNQRHIKEHLVILYIKSSAINLYGNPNIPFLDNDFCTVVINIKEPNVMPSPKDLDRLLHIRLADEERLQREEETEERIKAIEMKKKQQEDIALQIANELLEEEADAARAAAKKTQKQASRKSKQSAKKEIKPPVVEKKVVDPNAERDRLEVIRLKVVEEEKSRQAKLAEKIKQQHIEEENRLKKIERREQERLRQEASRLKAREEAAVAAEQRAGIIQVPKLEAVMKEPEIEDICNFNMSDIPKFEPSIIDEYLMPLDNLLVDILLKIKNKDLIVYIRGGHAYRVYEQIFYMINSNIHPKILPPTVDYDIVIYIPAILDLDYINRIKKDTIDEYQHYIAELFQNIFSNTLLININSITKTYVDELSRLKPMNTYTFEIYYNLIIINNYYTNGRTWSSSYMYCALINDKIETIYEFLFTNGYTERIERNNINIDILNTGYDSFYYLQTFLLDYNTLIQKSLISLLNRGIDRYIKQYSPDDIAKMTQKYDKDSIRLRYLFTTLTKENKHFYKLYCKIFILIDQIVFKCPRFPCTKEIKDKIYALIINPTEGGFEQIKIEVNPSLLTPFKYKYLKYKQKYLQLLQNK